MCDRLVHRGPDDSGAWADEEAGIAFGFRRLAIIDLSHQGHQPMHSRSGRYVIMYNGEIYNFRALRAQLEQAGHSQWRGHSDTEVLVEAVALWGFEEAVRRCNGMFAIAVWDTHTHTLWLARDRAGEKPLYYAWLGSTLVFGSELKALSAHPQWKGDIDRTSLAQYLRLRYVPGPATIYRGVYKLPAGHTMCVTSLGGGADYPHASLPFWSPQALAERAFANPYAGSEASAVEHLRTLLGDSVALRMMSDVPLGAFLSGGVDSSLIAALMCERASGPVRTFSIGFREAAFDEAPAARAVAAHLGTQHTELYVTGRDAMDLVPHLPQIYDEPFADSSQLPTALLSRLTRAHVTVALSGDAGDELFAGYNRHVWIARLTSILQHMPQAARFSSARALELLSPAMWNRMASSASRLLGRPVGMSHFGDSMHKLARVLRAPTPSALYEKLVTDWDVSSLLVRQAGADAAAIRLPTLPRSANDVQAFMYLDFLTYMQDDILVKVDRAAMASSLETRVPFLDPAVIDFAWHLPVSLNIRHGRGKSILRALLARYVPPRLTNRPKQGFAVPIGQWLRGPLRDWAEDLLDPYKMDEEGFLHTGLVRRAWEKHMHGQDEQHRLWSILMFQSWLRSAR